MGLEEVQDEILRKADQESKQIIADGKAEEAKILGKSKDQIKAYKQQRELETTKNMQNIEKLGITETELDIQKNRFQAKKELIDSVYEAAAQRLARSKKRKAYLQKLFTKAKSELKVARIYCNKSDAGAFKGVKIENKQMLGGFIAENANGTISVDYTFETLISDLKEKTLSQVAQLLF